MSDLLTHLSDMDYLFMGALSFERFQDTFSKLSPADEQHVLQVHIPVKKSSNSD